MLALFNKTITVYDAMCFAYALLPKTICELKSLTFETGVKHGSNK